MVKHVGVYVILDGDSVSYDGDDISKALYLMKKASDKAKLYKIQRDEEGAVIGRVLLAFRKSVPKPKTTANPAFF